MPARASHFIVQQLLAVSKFPTFLFDLTANRILDWNSYFAHIVGGNQQKNSDSAFFSPDAQWLAPISENCASWSLENASQCPKIPARVFDARDDAVDVTLQLVYFDPQSRTALVTMECYYYWFAEGIYANVQKIFNSFPGIITVRDKQGGLLVGNSYTKDFYGKDLQQLLGTKLAADPFMESSAFKDVLEETLSRNQAVQQEFKVTKEDQSFWFATETLISVGITGTGEE